MEIILYRNEQCLASEKALSELKLALSILNIKDKPRVKYILNQNEAEKSGFYGSPTIQIDGKDIDPNLTEVPHKLSFETCRIYFYKGRYFEYPPKEMILDYLKLVHGK